MAYPERYPERMSVADLARRWKVSKQVIRTMIRKGDLETLPHEPGRKIFITNEMACRAMGYAEQPQPIASRMHPADLDYIVEQVAAKLRQNA